ncbi:hypothetical protein HYV50_03740 [Candidatus Pacearchaeota archaeon]|nr:hypothetical protein [Candidatus Pacearchaeota archaeon]
MKKRGLSEIVTTVLIVLLALVAIGLVWTFIRGTIGRSGSALGSESKLLEIRYSIVANSVVPSVDGKSVTFFAERETGGGDVNTFPVFSVEDKNGNMAAVYNYNTTKMNELERISVVINGADYGLTDNITKISVFAAIFDEEGNTKKAQIPSDDYEIREVGASGSEISQTPATLSSAEPACDSTLPRIKNNTILLRFDHAITLPGTGQILIQEILDGGNYGTDLSGSFTFAVTGNDLRMTENGIVLQNQRWYSVRNTGGFSEVNNFKIDYAVVYGDANNDTFTDIGDLSYISADFGTNNYRSDINADGTTDSNDRNDAVSNLGSYAPIKPTGHLCS